MPDTANYALTYPASTSNVRLWEHIQALADDTDAALSYGGTGAVTVESTIDFTGRTTTSGTYTATLTAAGICGVAFVAPPCGKVSVSLRVDISVTGTTSFTFTSFEVRTGSSVGSGSVFLAADDARAMRQDGITSFTGSLQHAMTSLVTGLTPGASYNVQFMQRANGNTLGVTNRCVLVVPQWR